MVMDKLPSHCQVNATTFNQYDYINFESMLGGVKTNLKFIKVPDFYTIDDKDYFAAEIKVEGLKIGTAALSASRILNIKLHDAKDTSQVRNLNFLIPLEANTKKILVEELNDTIIMRAPVKRGALLKKVA